MTDALTPGSLAARILDHMRLARGEFEAGELAETLQTDLAETRKALQTLRAGHHATMRNEDGHPLYRASGTEPETIPGSAMKIIGEKKATGHETKAAPPETKPGIPDTEPPMAKPKPKHNAHLMTRPRHQEQVLAFLKARPGGHTRASVISGVGLTVAQVRVALKALASEGKVGRQGNTSNSVWHLPGEKVTTAPKGPANRASATPPGMKPNLAYYGAPRKDVPATPRVSFAIDERGTVAIDTLRLPAAEIPRLVAFLEKTQHVWKAAA